MNMNQSNVLKGRSEFRNGLQLCEGGDFGTQNCQPTMNLNRRTNEQ